ncbi:NUDIX hydrolase [Parathalassolituus penaei]|uniref:Phosphatase NudJ n=1 Tax=Parathalassolituus penaei TaxID=2997323 RepID=A0A9X3EDT9_9GAMM|nr:NUDIX hydrolase [Parathalassolituus penaei]MCY0965370.1 NUDIX hydrolase [Parathalassolituus penaei]
MQTRWTPHATVATIVEKDGRFLMVEETINGQAVINQPAGHIEEGERILDAACRETLEETGWMVTPTALVGLYTYTAPSNGITYHRYCFSASVDHEIENAVLDNGIVGPRWMTIEELRTCPHLRSQMVLTCVEDYLSGRQYPLNLIVEHP